MPYLTRDFFARPCLEVASALLGCRLVHRIDPGTRLVGTIVEVEAYLGDGSDPASHSHRGPTARNRVMFGAPGHFYVYLCMGLHLCANLACEPEGHGAAVLLRAVEPLEGVEQIRRARGRCSSRELTNGPGKLSQAFGITLRHDGTSALRGDLRIAARPAGLDPRILSSPRIGLSRGIDLPYRLFLADNPHITRSPLNRQARPASQVF